MAATETHQAIEAVFRIEQARLIGGLARMVRDVGLAEELAQDALVAALAEWPQTGVPDKPGAWLMATAKRRAIDIFRRDKMLSSASMRKSAATWRMNAIPASRLSKPRSMMIWAMSFLALSSRPVIQCYRPRRARRSRLRLIGGLTTDEIARAFLSSEATIAQRIVRAKKTLGDAGPTFEVPHGKEREARLASVLEVVYLIFNEGYAATAGEDLIRPALCAEAQRLGRILAGLMPEEPEVLGLLALMEIQASRFKARTAPDGSLVPLTEQNRAYWDQLLIRRGLAGLERAEALGGATGPYALQAALAACHARARKAEQTDWEKIAALYDKLREVMPSPVVDLNRAVAHSMAFGPQVGLTLIGEIERAAVLRNYAPLPAAKGDFLFRAGRLAEAKVEFERAASLTRNEREKSFLLGRVAVCDG